MSDHNEGLEKMVAVSADAFKDTLMDVVKQMDQPDLETLAEVIETRLSAGASAASLANEMEAAGQVMGQGLQQAMEAAAQQAVSQQIITGNSSAPQYAQPIWHVPPPSPTVPPLAGSPYQAPAPKMTMGQLLQRHGLGLPRQHLHEAQIERDADILGNQPIAIVSHCPRCASPMYGPNPTMAGAYSVSKMMEALREKGVEAVVRTCNCFKAAWTRGYNDGPVDVTAGAETPVPEEEPSSPETTKKNALLHRLADLSLYQLERIVEDSFVAEDTRQVRQRIKDMMTDPGGSAG